MQLFISRHRWTLVIAAALALIGLRFALVATSPNGFYIDEVATGAHVQHMVRDGTDYHGSARPLMSQSLGGGYTTGVYLYPLAVWAAVFGTSEVSLRSFSQFVTIAAIVTLAYAVYILRNRRAAVLALFAGLLLPWSWIGGNLAWDPAITPLFVSLAILCFAVLHSRAPRLQQRHIALLLAGLTLALVLAAYSYPPTRVAAPLLLVGVLIYVWRSGRVPLVMLSVPVVVGAISSIPLALFVLSPDALDRSASLHVFRDGLLAGVLAFGANILQLLNPDSLFLRDTSNLRHTAGRYGALGLFALIGLAGLVYAAIKRRITAPRRQLIIIMAVGALVGFAASALTLEGQPHYLRAVTAWPFVVILVALGWEYIIATQARTYIIIAEIIAVLLLVGHLSITYPQISASEFNSRDNPRPAESHQRVLDMYYD